MKNRPSPLRSSTARPEAIKRSGSSASGPLQKLAEGYARFREQVFPRERELFARLQKGQSPHTMLITCADSRIVPSLVLEAGPGEIFVVRNVGNLVPPYGNEPNEVAAAVEFAVAALQVRAIIVCGHSDCGAMKAIANPGAAAELPAVARWLRFAEPARQVVAEASPRRNKESKLDALIKENVVVQLANLCTYPRVAAALQAERLELAGWLYDIGKGQLCEFDFEQRTFTPIEGPMLKTLARPRL